MLIKEREKYKSTALFKCDNCKTEFEGNYYVLNKKEKHLCRSCACKNGWEENNKNKKTFISDELKKYIIKRVDGKNLNYLPKSKYLKIIIKCSKCGKERQSNSFDVLNKNSILCLDCKLYDINPNPKRSKKNKSVKKERKIKKSIKEKIDYGYRKTPEYRKKMSESMKKSKAWKESNDLRIEGAKKYWKKLRGGKNIEEIYTEWKLYKKLVYGIMDKNYRKYKKIINPENFPREKRKYHVDHKFSVLEGFKNNILPSIISHPFNLEMKYYKDNLSKDFRCSITKKELLGGTIALGSGGINGTCS